MVTRSQVLDANRRAGEVLEAYKARDHIGSGYTRIDPVKIADDAGVAVVFKPMDKLLGAFIRGGRPGIILNLVRPPGLLHMTCAHELGHFFLEHPTTADVEIENRKAKSPLEREADEFAYALIAPRWLIVHIMKKKNWSTHQLRQPSVIYQLSLRLGTSYKSTVWTLNRNGIFDFDTAKVLSQLAPKEFKQTLLKDETPVSWHSDVWLLDDTDRDLIIEPHADDNFVIDLPNHASAGYIWSVENAISEGFQIQPMLHNVDTRPLASPGDGLTPVGLPGALRCVVWKENTDADSVMDDKIHVSLVESQPWVGETPSDTRFGFSAEFESLNEGLSKAEKQRLIFSARDVA